MKNKIKSFKDDWENGVEPNMIRNRLSKLVRDGIIDCDETDSLLDRLSRIRKDLLKFYGLKESDI